MTVTIDLRQFEALAFDLDGVVTKTAVVHAAAWKRTLDEVLERLADGKRWIHAVKTAVVTASENGAAILTAAHLTRLFDVRVDGRDLAHLGLRGKPAPDLFLEAARRLGVEPRRCIVVEDSIAGVGAGHAGGFGLVIGVDRAADADALRRSGADLVVAALDELVLVHRGAELELR